MTVTLNERINTREATVSVLDTDGQNVLRYVAFSDATSVNAQQSEVHQAVINDTPAFQFGHPRTAPRITEIGEGYWDVIVQYSTQKDDRDRKNETAAEGQSSQFQFNFSGVTQRIRQSVKLVSKTANAPGTVDKSEPINFDGERVDGVDIIVPQASFSETHWFGTDAVSDDLKFTWLRSVGKTNEKKFRNADPGELLLTKVSGSQKNSEPWAITFEFLFSENITQSFDIYPQGGGAAVATDVDKKGFELFEFGYEPIVALNQKINQLIWVRVQEVYKSTDFDDLELPE